MQVNARGSSIRIMKENLITLSGNKTDLEDMAVSGKCGDDRTNILS
jgi:hypothetical protein